MTQEKKELWLEASAEWPSASDFGPTPRGSDSEILNPHHECPSRRTGLLPATFNLVATIVGGGILSIPLAFEKCGVVLATILMVVAAVLTDFSLYILCSCSRRTGARSYGEVCKLSYGPGLEVFTSLLLFVFLLFVIIAYMVLVRDIWTPVVTLALTNHGQNKGSDSVLPVESGDIGNIVLLAIVILMTPFMLKKDLHALRYNCYVGFASITILCFAITHRAWEKYNDSPSGVHPDPIALFPKQISDVLFAFPIIALSFLSQFNIVSIHGSLVNPTRKRIRQVIDNAVGMCFLLTYAFGLMGYLLCGPTTQGNILLNFDFGDKFVLVGRLGCGVTIALAMPMMVLPCRESALALGPQFAAWRANDGVDQCLDRIEKKNEPGSDSEDESDDEGPIQLEMARSDSHDEGDAQTTPDKVVLYKRGTEQESLLNSNGSHPTYDAPDPELPAKRESDECDSRAPVPKVSESSLLHVVSTLMIVSTCYVGAVAAPGVAFVWSICGSSMAFLIAFIFPAMCYIKVRAKHKGHFNRRILASWLMLGFAIVGCAACTVQTLWRMFFLSSDSN